MTSTFASTLNIQCETFDDDYVLMREDIGENDVFYTEDEVKFIKAMPDETFYDTSDKFTPEPTAPPMPMTSHALLEWYLFDAPITDGELTPALISEMEELWLKITGHPFAMYLADCDLLNIIQNLQFREHQLQRLYNEGMPVPRTTMMGLHARFFDDFGCRISDFYTNESFKRAIDDFMDESFV